GWPSRSSWRTGSGSGARPKRGANNDDGTLGDGGRQDRVGRLLRRGRRRRLRVEEVPRTPYGRQQRVALDGPARRAAGGRPEDRLRPRGTPRADENPRRDGGRDGGQHAPDWRTAVKTVIHINQHRIKRNRLSGEREPVITCKTYLTNSYAHE